MKRAFENSCIRGCAIYFAVLIILLVASAAGFGGLSARFGLGSHAVQGSLPATSPGAADVPAPQATTVITAQAQASGSGPVIVFDTPQPQQQAAPPTATPAVVPALPTVAPVQPSAPAPVEPAYAPQVQAQGGEIKGQASQPFYIVQSNDTLSGIASRFSTTVEAMRQANNLADVNSIWPGQLLYLPEAVPVPAPAPSGPQGQSGQPSSDSPATQGGPGQMPSMPNTGINSGR